MADVSTVNAEEVVAAYPDDVEVLLDRLRSTGQDLVEVEERRSYLRAVRLALYGRLRGLGVGNQVIADAAGLRSGEAVITALTRDRTARAKAEAKPPRKGRKATAKRG